MSSIDELNALFGDSTPKKEVDSKAELDALFGQVKKSGKHYVDQVNQLIKDLDEINARNGKGPVTEIYVTDEVLSGLCGEMNVPTLSKYKGRELRVI